MGDRDNAIPETFQEFVYDAIFKIKRRKQRPSLERIKHTVESSAGPVLPSSTFLTHLDSMSDRGTLDRYIVKGSHTYSLPPHPKGAKGKKSQAAIKKQPLATFDSVRVHGCRRSNIKVGDDCYYYYHGNATSAPSQSPSCSNPPTTSKRMAGRKRRRSTSTTNKDSSYTGCVGVAKTVLNKPPPSRGDNLGNSNPSSTTTKDGASNSLSKPPTGRRLGRPAKIKVKALSTFPIPEQHLNILNLTTTTTFGTSSGPINGDASLLGYRDTKEIIDDEDEDFDNRLHPRSPHHHAPPSPSDPSSEEEIDEDVYQQNLLHQTSTNSPIDAGQEMSLIYEMVEYLVSKRALIPNPSALPATGESESVKSRKEGWRKEDIKTLVRTYLLHLLKRILRPNTAISSTYLAHLLFPNNPSLFASLFPQPETTVRNGLTFKVILKFLLCLLSPPLSRTTPDISSAGYTSPNVLTIPILSETLASLSPGSSSSLLNRSSQSENLSHSSPTGSMDSSSSSSSPARLTSAAAPPSPAGPQSGTALPAPGPYGSMVLSKREKSNATKVLKKFLKRAVHSGRAAKEGKIYRFDLVIAPVPLPAPITNDVAKKCSNPGPLLSYPQTTAPCGTSSIPSWTANKPTYTSSIFKQPTLQSGGSCRLTRSSATCVAAKNIFFAAVETPSNHHLTHDGTLFSPSLLSQQTTPTPDGGFNGADTGSNNRRGNDMFSIFTGTPNTVPSAITFSGTLTTPTNTGSPFSGTTSFATLNPSSPRSTAVVPGQAGQIPPGTGCTICYDKVTNTRTNHAEELLSCADCGQSCHPSCLNYSSELTAVIKRMRWQCVDCKKCCKCGQSVHKNNIRLCTTCDRGFHKQCSDSSPTKCQSETWLCPYCVNLKNKQYIKNVAVGVKKRYQQVTPLRRSTNYVDRHSLRYSTRKNHLLGNISQTHMTSPESLRKKGAKSIHHLDVTIPTNDKTSGLSNGNDLKFVRRRGRPPLCNRSSTQRNQSINITSSINNTPVRMGSQQVKYKQRFTTPLSISSRYYGKRSHHKKVSPVAKATAKPLNANIVLPPNVTMEDYQLYQQAKALAQKRLWESHVKKKDIPSNETARSVSADDTTDSGRGSPGGVGKLESMTNINNSSYQTAALNVCPASIEIGCYEIQTWYSSPYPQEYARMPKLFLCEFCLKYMKSKMVLDRHKLKCRWTNPPGNEIYRKNGLSVFEVDGNVSKIYCQNICLLAKLFLDHKTLYYDVEPFLFYTLTKNDTKGSHLVGYFSKEKNSPQKYNVSCIMTLPPYQQHGYGRLLIDFSYLLSRKEGQPGTPEKPLSDLGRLAYTSYWRGVILDYLNEHRNSETSFKAISESTGLSAYDIAQVLQILDLLKYNESSASFEIKVDNTILEERIRKKYLELDSIANNKRIDTKTDESRLVWDPNKYRDDCFQANETIQDKDDKETVSLSIKQNIYENRDSQPSHNSSGTTDTLTSPNFKISHSSPVINVKPRKKRKCRHWLDYHKLAIRQKKRALQRKKDQNLSPTHSRIPTSSIQGTDSIRYETSKPEPLESPIKSSSSHPNVETFTLSEPTIMTRSHRKRLTADSCKESHVDLNKRWDDSSSEDDVDHYPTSNGSNFAKAINQSRADDHGSTIDDHSNHSSLQNKQGTGMDESELMPVNRNDISTVAYPLSPPHESEYITPVAVDASYELGYNGVTMQTSLDKQVVDTFTSPVRSPSHSRNKGPTRYSTLNNKTSAPDTQSYMGSLVGNDEPLLSLGAIKVYEPTTHSLFENGTEENVDEPMDVPGDLYTEEGLDFIVKEAGMEIDKEIKRMEMDDMYGIIRNEQCQQTFSTTGNAEQDILKGCVRGSQIQNVYDDKPTRLNPFPNSDRLFHESTMGDDNDDVDCVSNFSSSDYYDSLNDIEPTIGSDQTFNFIPGFLTYNSMMMGYPEYGVTDNNIVTATSSATIPMDDSYGADPKVVLSPITPPLSHGSGGVNPKSYIQASTAHCTAGYVDTNVQTITQDSPESICCSGRTSARCIDHDILNLSRPPTSHHTSQIPLTSFPTLHASHHESTESYDWSLYSNMSENMNCYNGKHGHAAQLLPFTSSVNSHHPPTLNLSQYPTLGSFAETLFCQSPKPYYYDSNEMDATALGLLESPQSLASNDAFVPSSFAEDKKLGFGEIDQKGDDNIDTNPLTGTRESKSKPSNYPTLPIIKALTTKKVLPVMPLNRDVTEAIMSTTSSIFQALANQMSPSEIIAPSNLELAESLDFKFENRNSTTVLYAPISNIFQITALSSQVNSRSSPKPKRSINKAPNSSASRNFKMAVENVLSSTVTTNDTTSRRRKLSGHVPEETSMIIDLNLNQFKHIHPKPTLLSPSKTTVSNSNNPTPSQNNIFTATHTLTNNIINQYLPLKSSCNLAKLQKLTNGIPVSSASAQGNGCSISTPPTSIITVNNTGVNVCCLDPTALLTPPPNHTPPPLAIISPRQLVNRVSPYNRRQNNPDSEYRHKIVSNNGCDSPTLPSYKAQPLNHPRAIRPNLSTTGPFNAGQATTAPDIVSWTVDGSFSTNHKSFGSNGTCNKIKSCDKSPLHRNKVNVSPPTSRKAISNPTAITVKRNVNVGIVTAIQHQKPELYPENSCNPVSLNISPSLLISNSRKLGQNSRPNRHQQIFASPNGATSIGSLAAPKACFIYQPLAAAGPPAAATFQIGGITWQMAAGQGSPFFAAAAATPQQFRHGQQHPHHHHPLVNLFSPSLNNTSLAPSNVSSIMGLNNGAPGGTTILHGPFPFLSPAPPPPTPSENGSGRPSTSIRIIPQNMTGAGNVSHGPFLTNYNDIRLLPTNWPAPFPTD